MTTTKSCIAVSLAKQIESVSAHQTQSDLAPFVEKNSHVWNVKRPMRKNNNRELKKLVFLFRHAYENGSSKGSWKEFSIGLCFFYKERKKYAFKFCRAAARTWTSYLSFYMCLKKSNKKQRRWKIFQNNFSPVRKKKLVSLWNFLLSNCVRKTFNCKKR